MEVFLKIRSVLILFVIHLVLINLTWAEEKVEHFTKGEIHAGLSWDNISAMEAGIYKFGGSAGVHVVNGVELGFEQQFVVPREQGAQKKSYGYLRWIPFRNWVVAPFVGLRTGLMFHPEENALVFGAGVGATYFASRNIAFEGRIYHQAEYFSSGMIERQTEFDWRVVLYF
jgi:hypothetical protein